MLKAPSVAVRGDNASFGVISTVEEKKPVDIPGLDAYAKESWESVLHSIAGIQTKMLTPGVHSLLTRSGLMHEKRLTPPKIFSILG